MPLNETSGNLTTDAFGGGVAVVPTYIEDVFSTWLYTGTGATQTITNGIDLSTKGGLIWLKQRTATPIATSHIWLDTVRGASNTLCSNDSGAQNTVASASNTFNINGFDLLSTGANSNGSGSTYGSWTFRKQPKFFDVVTYTGNGANRTIAHNLGSVPGCIMVKRTDTTGDWQVYHRSNANTQYMVLNTTDAVATGATRWNSTTPTSTVFSLGTGTDVNASGGTYVAYIFAHNAGGFGLTGTDNVISCGSYTQSTGQVVNLGFEPQWIMIKRTDDTSNWIIEDVMRGQSYTQGQQLRPNLANAEVAAGSDLTPTANGFIDGNALSGNVIYIAIRRGPMKVPTDGTKVFKPVAATPSGSQDTVTTGFPTDFIITTERSHSLTGSTFAFDRLRGSTTTYRTYLTTQTTNAETNASGGSFGLDSNVAVYDNFYQYSGITNPVIYWNFRRAPSFFDEVCYTGTGSARSINHNLGVLPELMIIKSRTSTVDWLVAANMTSTTYRQLYLNTNQACVTGTDIAYTNGAASITVAPTSTTFGVGPYSAINGSGNNYVSYLFATCAGVSKVGSYTGTGTLTTINCGFAGGARFVLIKRTDSTSNWFVWDTARGMVSGTDPSLALNSTAAESNANSVYTITTGFQLLASPSADVNTSGGSYIYLAVA